VSDSEKIKQKALKSHNEDNSTTDESLNSEEITAKSSSKSAGEKISGLTDKTQQQRKKRNTSHHRARRSLRQKKFLH
jgi:hypothetical protein